MPSEFQTKIFNVCKHTRIHSWAPLAIWQLRLLFPREDLYRGSSVEVKAFKIFFLYYMLKTSTSIFHTHESAPSVMSLPLRACKNCSYLARICYGSVGISHRFNIFIVVDFFLFFIQLRSVLQILTQSHLRF